MSGQNMTTAISVILTNPLTSGEQKVRGVMDIIDRHCQGERMQRHELAMQALVVMDTRLVEYGDLATRVLEGLLADGYLDEDLYRKAPISRYYAKHLEWMNGQVRGAIRCAWGDDWWKDFKQRSEPSSRKAYPLRCLTHLSKEEAVERVAAAADAIDRSSRRQKKTDEWQQLDFKEAAANYEAFINHVMAPSEEGPETRAMSLPAQVSASRPQHLPPIDGPPVLTSPLGEEAPRSSGRQSASPYTGGRGRAAGFHQVTTSSALHTSPLASQSTGETPRPRPVERRSLRSSSRKAKLASTPSRSPYRRSTRKSTAARPTRSISRDSSGRSGSELSTPPSSPDSEKSDPVGPRNKRAKPPVHAKDARLWAMPEVAQVHIETLHDEQGKYTSLAKTTIDEWGERLMQANEELAKNPTPETKARAASLVRESSVALLEAGVMLDEKMADAQRITLPYTLEQLDEKRGIWIRDHPDGKLYAKAEWEEIKARWDRETAALDLVKGSVVVSTSDDHLVMWKIDGGLSEDLVAHLTQTNLDMFNSWLDLNPTLPGAAEVDNRHDDVEAAIAKYGKDDVGVFHLGCKIPIQADPKGPILTSETVAGSYKFRIMANYEAQLEGFLSLVNNTMRLLAPDVHARYEEYMDDLTASWADLKSFVGLSQRLHLSTAVVHNLRVLPHTDSLDLRDGLVVMTNLSRAGPGANLVVGTAGVQIKIDYNPGDLVLFNSYMLAHGVTPFLGDAPRTAIVLFSHRNTVHYEPELEDTPGSPIIKRYGNKEVGLDFIQEFL